MPIFCEETCTSGSGRSVISSPEIILWIDSAASWPCATAQMMFFGPNAASPPKNTFGFVETKVFASTCVSIRRLTDFGHNPSWSHDGTRIAVSTERTDLEGPEVHPRDGEL